MGGPFSPSGHGWGGEARAGCCSPWVFTQEFLSVPVSHLKDYSLDLPGTRDALLYGALIPLPVPQPCRLCCWEHSQLSS